MLERQDLFVAGEGGYHTYRIPALAVTTAGTLLAFCEGRRHGRGDAGEIDLLQRRSTDGGRTWDETRVVLSEPGMTCGNPAPVVDRERNVIWLPFCKNLAEGGQTQICAGQAPRTVWLTSSEDDGATWSTPVEITGDVKAGAWTWYATGPGHGVQLASGRLVVACDHQVGRNFTRADPGYSHVIFSDDHGATWRTGGVVGQEGTNESAVVELEDGTVYLNCRDQQKRGRRCGAWSRDGGLSFPESLWHEALIEPACQGSLERLPGSPGGPAPSRDRPPGDRRDGFRLLFANPASTDRARLTVRLSADGGRGWSPGRLLEPGPAAYSDLVVVPDGEDGTVIGCLYECGTHSPYERITLARFDPGWLEQAPGHEPDR